MAEMTIVETFECHEVAHEPIEIAQEAVSIIDELGLTGQRNFIAKPGDKMTTRAPYRTMTEEEIGVYSTLCPDQIEIERYNGSPMPLRVLQIAAHAKQTIPGLKLEVWDKKQMFVKDPVLVGKIGGSRWSSDYKVYILARWGSELEAFAILRDKAIASIRERLRDEAKSLLSMIDTVSSENLLTNRESKVPSLR